MIFDRALRKSAAAGPGAALGGVLTLDNAAGWDGWTAETAGMSRDRAMKLSTVNRCVEVRATSMALLPTYLMNEQTKTRLSGHPLERVLWDQANEAMSRSDYERLMQCNLDLKGNAYAWIERDGRTGRPRELIPLHPDHVTPYVALDSSLWYIYTNPRTGEMSRVHPADMLHYKGYSVDGIEGISILHRAALSIGTGLAAQQYQNDIYTSGGRPSGVLTVAADLGGYVTVTNGQGEEEKVSKKELIRREWNKIHSGGGNGFRTAVLDLGMKYEPIAMSNSDAQFCESEDLRVADMCRFFGVPLHLVYAGKESYASNEQNSLEFVKYTLQFLITQREQEDSRKLLLPGERRQGLRVRREMKAFLRGDTAAQAAWYKAMRECGAYDVDEIRALEDLPAVPGGKSRYASWNYGPLEKFDELSVLRALGRKQKEE